MNHIQKKKLPKWPDSLPPPTEMTMLPQENYVYRDELIEFDDINALIHDMYYFSEERYFLYYEYHSKNIPEGFDVKLLNGIGLAFRKHENYFYKRPWSDERPDVYSYIRFLPGDVKYEWQKKLVEEGPMYGRVEIELMEWKKKQIDLYLIQQASNKESDPLILQPNFMGIGVDLRKIPAWIKDKIKKFV